MASPPSGRRFDSHAAEIHMSRPVPPVVDEGVRCAKSRRDTRRACRRRGCPGRGQAPRRSSGRCDSSHSAGSIRPVSARSCASATRSAADQEKGHKSTGSVSCEARRPSLIALVAEAGSPTQRFATAFSPARGNVTIQEPSSSDPASTTTGTRTNCTAQSSRVASAARSTLSAGDYFPKRRPSPSPYSHVTPPTPLCQTTRTGRPQASAST